MAESLGVHPSQFDFNDKKEFMKRIKHESEGLSVVSFLTSIIFNMLMKFRRGILKAGH